MHIKNKRKLLSALSFLIACVIVLIFASCNMGADKSSDEEPSTADNSSSPVQPFDSSLDSNVADVGSDTPANLPNNSALIVVPPENPIYSLSNLDEIEKLPSKKNGWGPGVGKNYSRPTGATQTQILYQKYDAYFIAPDTKKVYLTFDEGYENGYTPVILDILKEKEVSAAFFITYDFAKSNPELVKRMINEGHLVGNHSHKHPSFPSLSAKEMIEEIAFLHTYVKDNFAYEMKYFRFPMGEYSEKSLAIVKALGYKSIFWSFAYVDWNVNAQPGTEKAFATITKYAHNGCIYLLHAVSKDNTAVLGKVIDDIKSKGYNLSSLDL